MNQLPPAVSEHHRREIFFAEIADLGIQRDQALYPDELLRILDNRLVTLFFPKYLRFALPCTPHPALSYLNLGEHVQPRNLDPIIRAVQHFDRRQN